MTPEEAIRLKPGLVATVITTGAEKPAFGTALSNLRSYNDRNGFHKVEYRKFSAVLVEAGRDAAISHALKEGYEWVLQIDADAAPFSADALERMLKTAYLNFPAFEVIGAYCQLKGGPNLPTIDTGTGTWEEHYPGEGVLPVIRTGAHFLFAKTSVFRRLPPPWFRSRQTMRPIAAMMEIDNFARMRGGSNALRDHPEWVTLLAEAAAASGPETTVGEDSGFCDRCKNYGIHIAVDTDLVVGHIDDKVILPTDFVDAREEGKKMERAAVGVLT